MPIAARVLIIEDDAHIRRLLRVAAERAGYRTGEAATAREGLSLLDIDKPDVVLLDLGLPDRDGLELIQLIKARGATLIVVSAREDTAEKVAALDLGADDYMTKPFNMEELLLRIRAILKRSAYNPIEQAEEGQFSLGKYTFDSLKQTLIFDGQESKKLTAKESELLRLLCESANRVLDRNYALKAIWHDDSYFNARSMDVYITKLRKYLKEDSEIEILNIHGKGFKLLVPGIAVGE